jgi:Flp pilus assembly protein TadD
LARVALAALLAGAGAGCANRGIFEPAATQAMASAQQNGDPRGAAAAWGERYRANPRDPVAAINYAQALRMFGQRAQAASVLEQDDDARRYYVTALKIVPEESSVLSNLGLSYALSRDLPQAEATLRRAAAGSKRVDPRVRQNLALVVGLQGRFAEAEQIARADLPPEEAAANSTYLRQMLAQQNAQQKRAQPNGPRG